MITLIVLVPGQRSDSTRVANSEASWDVSGFLGTRPRILSKISRSVAELSKLGIICRHVAILLKDSTATADKLIEASISRTSCSDLPSIARAFNRFYIVGNFF